MSDFQFEISIARVGPRPPYRELVDHVYGIGANVDTDGDSIPASSTDWTWLYMSLRPQADIPVVVVSLSDDLSDLLLVQSNDQDLATRTASFLAYRTGGIVVT